jgi:hypothetical protein
MKRPSGSITGRAAMLGALLFAGAAWAQNYTYTATLQSNSPQQGAVVASGITWKCGGNACQVSGPWPQPGVFACQALAARVGPVASYGRPGAMLDKAQMAQCNQSAAPITHATMAPAKPMAMPMAPMAAPTTKPTAPMAKPMAKPTAIQNLQPVPMAGKVSPVEMQKRTQEFNQLSQQRIRDIQQARVQLHPDLHFTPPRVLGSASGSGSSAPLHPVVVSQGDDCNDQRADVYRGATEVCDGVDNNCDGIVDEGQTLTFYLDADGDGHGDPNHRVDACPADQSAAAASGHWLVMVGNDCNDADPDHWHDCP